MVYYPLQLLQRAGVREVLLVTGQQHAGDFIDLLGDGRVASRATGEPLFDVDLSYKVQVEPGGIAQVVGMARAFAGGDGLVVCLGDNIFEHAHADAISGWRSDGALVFGKEVPDPENFGVIVYDGDGGVAGGVEKAGPGGAGVRTAARRRAGWTRGTPSRGRGMRWWACTAIRRMSSTSSTGWSRRAAG